MDYLTALDYIKSAGYKPTVKRKEMIKIFFNHDQLFSANIIFHLMRIQFPFISIDTIYKNLNLFKQLSLINRTVFKKQFYYYRNRAESSFYGHIICLECRSVKSLIIKPSRSLISYSDFVALSYKFEIYGRCNKCKQSSLNACIT